MSLSPRATGATGSDPITPPDPTPGANLFSVSRVKQAANSIADHVREALTTDGFVPVRVMVVDDHPDAADALAAVLELLGCPVRTCYSGASALAVAETFNPQVCLLDLMMPEMDGLELAARLKDRSAGRPLLLVATTAFGDAETQARTALAGFHYHLTKPVDDPNRCTYQLGKIITRSNGSTRRATRRKRPDPGGHVTCVHTGVAMSGLCGRARDTAPLIRPPYPIGRLGRTFRPGSGATHVCCCGIRAETG